MSKPQDLQVGYKKPPVHSRFKPGQSGNPLGRPKKTSVGFELVAELHRKVTVRENGLEHKMSKAAALAKSLVARALAGDMRAVSHLIRLLPAQFQAPADIVDESFSGTDAAVLERFIERRLAAISEAKNSKEVPETQTRTKDNENE